MKISKQILFSILCLSIGNAILGMASGTKGMPPQGICDGKPGTKKMPSGPIISKHLKKMTHKEESKTLVVSMPNLKKPMNVFISTTYVDPETKQTAYGYNYNGTITPKDHNYVTVTIPETLVHPGRHRGCDPAPAMACWEGTPPFVGQASCVSVITYPSDQLNYDFTFGYATLSDSRDGDTKLEIQDAMSNSAVLLRAPQKPALGSKIEEKMLPPIKIIAHKIGS